ncbi:hypothetical protein CPB86DRAFT_781897 [Serendipita vermifera]|nr:hypothetical protein CPB86DRAFT_781897 [Serendipita vermifera]
MPPKSPTALRTNLPTFEKDGSSLSPNNNAPLVSPVLGHHRSLSLSSPWSRFPATGPASNTATAKSSQERTAGIFRRLSLSSGAGPFQRPTIPMINEPTTNEDTGNALFRAQTIGTSTAGTTLPRTRPHGRRATLSPGDAPKPRAPSPMGERMLKGHFDGFV